VKSHSSYVVFAFLLACVSLAAAQQIPPGTVLPVMLNSTLDARHAKPGEIITGHIMQDVPLPDNARIRCGARVVGHIVSASTSPAARLTVSFDQVEFRGKPIPIAAHLRALASAFEVTQAGLPTNTVDDYGSSTSDWNTMQIGGAEVFRGSGEVMTAGSVVGRATDYGAVTAQLQSAPQRGCSSGSSREQSLWLFSPWACGTYGLGDLRIVPAGRPGDITLESSGNVRVIGGSGWLLQVDPAS